MSNLKIALLAIFFFLSGISGQLFTNWLDEPKPEAKIITGRISFFPPTEGRSRYFYTVEDEDNTLFCDEITIDDRSTFTALDDHLFHVRFRKFTTQNGKMFSKKCHAWN
ncbi:hypothetical protein [Acetobacter pasteurianus]|uniref:hypothetical protein n=1 Tax=Acetobacter pasteurianus TaxID=438 RepID=UPI003D148BB3